MNFIALIGIVDQFKKIDNNNYKVKIKVEKSDYADDEEWYELLTVDLNENTFANENKDLPKGTIIGVKGRIISRDNTNKIIGERLQVF